MTGKFSHLALRRGFGAGVSLLALGWAGQASADCAGTMQDGICVITNSGTSPAVTIAAPTRLVNSGTISGAPAVTGTSPQNPALGNPYLEIRNAAGGTISATDGTAISSPGLLVNAGTLDGNLRLGTGAPSDFTSQTFIQRGDTIGVTGTINAGMGIDVFARSYSSSTNVTLGTTALPTSFEVEGVEVRGQETTVTLGAPEGVMLGGVALLGDGNIVNEAHVGPFNTVGAFPPNAQVFVTAVSYGGVPGTTRAAGLIVPPNETFPNGTSYSFTYGAALNSFVNRGVIDGDIRIATAAFTNEGDINLLSPAAPRSTSPARGR